MSGWPWPGDTELAKARRVAIAYRTTLHQADLLACEDLDQRMRYWGQWWVLPRPTVYDDYQAITADLAAELVSRTEPTIRRWAAAEHPTVPGRKLLPGFGWDGSRRTYLVKDVLDAAVIVDARTTYRRQA